MSYLAERRRWQRRCLEQLKQAGLLDYSLSHLDFDGPEPHLEVWTTAEKLGADARHASSDAQKMWEWLRANRVIRMQ